MSASGSRSGSIASVMYWGGAALLAATIIFGLVEPIATLWRHVPLDPNEGWNAFFTQTAMHGGQLYPAPGSGIVNNYPPLSFYIVGLVANVLGDNIVAGRTVALAGMLIVAVNVYLWLRAAGSGVRIAWLGAGLFAAFAVIYARSYAGMDDPQWLAHAIMTTGLVVLWRGNASARAIALGALLIQAGGWTKHLLIPLPIAITWWLLRRSKAAFWTWIAWSALLLGAIGVLVFWLYGAAFFDGLLTPREYSIHQAIKETRWALYTFTPLIVLSLLLLPFVRGSERREFALAYLAVAAVVAFGAAGGSGVDINAFFDLMIAASLCGALAVEALWELRLPGALRTIETGPALALLLGIYLGVYALRVAPETLRNLRGLDALEQETLAATRLIADQGHGRTACEEPELCYWAKNEFTIDFFNYGQRLKLGRRPVVPCASFLDGRNIPLLQLNPRHGHKPGFLPQDCVELIERNYRPLSVSTLGVILGPAPPANPP
jgi:hypothetical protein